MNRPLLVGVVLLLCGSCPISAGPVAPAAPHSVDAPDAATPNGPAPAQVTTNVSDANDSGDRSGPTVLTPPSAATNRTAFPAPDANLSASLSLRTAELDAQFRTLRMQERLAAVESADAKRDRVRERMTAIHDATETLRVRQREALAAHAAGHMGTDRLLVRLAQIDVAAGAFRARANVLANVSERTPGVSVESDARVAALELRAFEGPVRDRVATTLGGGGDPTANRIYVRTTPEGVVLSTIADGTHIREAYAGSLRADGDETDRERMPISALNDVLARSYPEVATNETLNSPSGAQASDVFLAHLDHRDGRITALVDRRERRVFRSVRRADLNESAAGPASVAVQSGLRITVNRTYAGGPMLVRVADARTGHPVEATVTYPTENDLRPVRLGTTNDATGVLWTTSPGGSFHVQAVHRSAPVGLDVRSLTPSQVRAGNASDAPPTSAPESATPTPTRTPTPTPTPTPHPSSVPNGPTAGVPENESAASGSDATPTAIPAPTRLRL